MGLESEFHQAMVGIYEEAREFDYNATRFLGMVVDRGGLAAAQQLLQGDKVSDGFAKLWLECRLDLTVEALVLCEPWRGLFTRNELAEAQRRLDESGYVGPGK